MLGLQAPTPCCQTRLPCPLTPAAGWPQPDFVVSHHHKLYSKCISGKKLHSSLLVCAEFIWAPCRSAASLMSLFTLQLWQSRTQSSLDFKVMLKFLPLSCSSKRWESYFTFYPPPKGMSQFLCQHWTLTPLSRAHTIWFQLVCSSTLDTCEDNSSKTDHFCSQRSICGDVQLCKLHTGWENQSTNSARGHGMQCWPSVPVLYRTDGAHMHPLDAFLISLGWKGRRAPPRYVPTKKLTLG